MILRKIFASLAGCALVLAPVASTAADRGPSTAEERTQMLEVIHIWQSDPMGPKAKDQFGAVLKWFMEVPDLTVHVCLILDKLPKGDKRDASAIFGGAMMGQSA